MMLGTKKYLYLPILSALSGLTAGLAATLFLYVLDYATSLRFENYYIVFFLPLAGLFIGWLYQQYGKEVVRGNNLILDEIHDPQKTIPARMAPMILLATVITHLFGGSAGREGTAVQMGASLSDQISRYFKLSGVQRRALLMAGMGAGFGAAIGVPWAGMVFGMEVLYVRKIQWVAVLECFIASWVGYFVSFFLRAPHSRYPIISVPPFSFQLLAEVLLAGLLFGLAARAFISLVHLQEKVITKIRTAPLRPLIGGFLVIALYQFVETYKYSGLGIEVIQKALIVRASYLDPIIKSIATAFTIGSGFKGGEFIPLVFVGTTLGSSLSIFFSGGAGFFGALGFGSVFGAAAKTPYACAIMVIEIFGFPIALYAFLAAYVAYWISGQAGIYSSQRLRP